MKKFIAVILVMALVFCAAACTTKEVVDDVLKDTETPDVLPTLTKGTVTDSAYESEYFGFGFRLPEGWRFATLDETAEYYDVDTSVLSGDIDAAIDEVDFFCDILAFNSDQTTNISVMIEKPDPSEYENTQAFVQSTLEVLESELSTIAPNVEVTTEPVTVGTQEFYGYKVTATQDDLSAYVSGFMAVRGDYVATVAVLGFSEQANADMLAQIYPVVK